MARPDLAALTDDGLAQLANAGLVKRALRELDAGSGPALEEEDDGTIVARFADDTLTRLPKGKALADASCTCPSSGFCRHRVMLALAYRQQARAGRGTPEAVESWDPASLDLDAFEAALGANGRTELTKLLASRSSVRLERGAVPVAHFPMASVRFLVPHDVGYARCDCQQAQMCVHVALAIRAFRAADGADGTMIGMAAAPLALDRSALQAAGDALLARLLDFGIIAGLAAFADGIERVLQAADALGAVQMRLVLEELTEQIAAYEARSARYDEHAVLALVAQIHARPRAGDAAMALGLGEPLETPMAKARLVSLGVRLRQEGKDVRASLVLADSDTGASLMFDKRLAPMPGGEGGIGQRLLAPAVPLGVTGRGQILTSVARRRADGALLLGAGSGGKTQVMPRSADFTFPTPMRVDDADTLAATLSRRPLSLVRPRYRAEDVHVFAVDAVLGQSWSAGAQRWQAAICLTGGQTPIYLERAYDVAAPGALQALFDAFDMASGAVRFVAGPVRLDGGALVCEPWSVSTDRFIVPDLDASASGNAEAPPELAVPPTLLDRSANLLAGALHAGLRAGTAPLVTVLARDLDAAGYRTLAAHLRQWQETGEQRAFVACALWLTALEESTVL